jgi:hypothetical protein
MAVRSRRRPRSVTWPSPALRGHYSNPAKQDELPTLLRLVRALLDSADDIAELVRRLKDR